MRGLETAYRLFGLLPDTLELRGLLLDLYAEQVAGYYDPDSAMLFGVAGAEREQLRLVLAHEMVHALQGQYLPLDSILDATDNNDRLTAAQSILEGQATLASIEVLAPGQDVTEMPQFWEMYREQVRETAVADAGLRRGAAGGAGGTDLSLSRRRRVHVLVEHVGAAGHAAVRAADAGVHRADPASRNGTRGATSRWCWPFPRTAVWPTRTCWARTRCGWCSRRSRGPTRCRPPCPLGWGGDRFRVYDAPGGPALVWYVVWDDQRSADRFVRTAGPKLTRTSRQGYRAEFGPVTVAGRAAVRYVLAPEGSGAVGGAAGGGDQRGIVSIR